MFLEAMFLKVKEMATQTITAKVQVNADRTLTVQLPDEIQTGEYEMVLVLNNTLPANNQALATSEHGTQGSPVADTWKTWVQEVEQLPITPNPTNSEYRQHLIEKYRKQGLDL